MKETRPFNPHISTIGVRFLIFIGCLCVGGCTAGDNDIADDTTNERWVVQELGTRAEFRDVFFLDEKRGWIVGGGFNIDGGILGATTDGGLTWSFRSGIVRPAARKTGFHLNATCFITENTGFIVGDAFQILRTKDGGKHWHRVPTASKVWAHLRDLQFVDASHGWAIGNGGLVRTVDGGETWEGPLMLDAASGNKNATRGQAVHFVDQNRGWLVGKNGLIRRTTNGGKSWALVDESGQSERPDLWGVDFSDHLRGWVVGAHGAILHSADGGETWEWQRSGVRDTLMDVDFVDSLHGWVVGFERSHGSSVVLHTIDGGVSWTEEARVTSEGIRAVFALDLQHAWAVGEQQLRSAGDGSQKFLRYRNSSEP